MPLSFFTSTLRVAVVLLWMAATATFAQTAGTVPTHRFGTSQPIAGRYIVVFNAGVSDPDGESDRMVRGFGGVRHFLYKASVKGFAASLPEAAVQRLRSDPAVAFVEQDHTISLNQVQSMATWGLDRIDQADRPLDLLYHYAQTGAGVYAFVIDTGIRADHVEFSGRVLPGYTAVADGRGTNDCNGHGTHVSGTVGGATLGVARGVSLTPVRVLDCNGSGTWSGVIAGIDWVANSTLRPAVANLSLGGAYSASVNSAVASAVAKGVTMVVAAGNDNVSACNSSPASEPTAITVGATSNTDARASFSNYGTCVDIFAPGVNITSAWNTSSTATNTISGTSMASPHVAGVAALALQANPSASPAAIASFITANATPNRLSSIGTGSPNLLVYSLGGSAIVEPALVVVAVQSLAGSAVSANNGWKAQVTITMRDVNTGAGAANVTVDGSFAPGGSVRCVTSSAGSCTVTSALLSRGTSSTAFSVSGASGSGVSYDASQNAASQIRIYRK